MWYDIVLYRIMWYGRPCYLHDEYDCVVVVCPLLISAVLNMQIFHQSVDILSDLLIISAYVAQFVEWVADPGSNPGSNCPHVEVSLFKAFWGTVKVLESTKCIQLTIYHFEYCMFPGAYKCFVLNKGSLALTLYRRVTR